MEADEPDFANLADFWKARQAKFGLTKVPLRQLLSKEPPKCQLFKTVYILCAYLGSTA